MALPRTVTVADVLTQTDGTPEIGLIKIAQRVNLRAGADGEGPGIITSGMRTARLAPDGSFTLTVFANDDPQWSPQGWSHTITIALLGHTETYDVLLPWQAEPYTLAELLPLLSPTAGAMYAPIGHTHEGGGGGSTAWADLTGVPATFPPSAHVHPQTDVTGLTTALAGKAATVHTHVQTDVTGLTDALAGKAATVHTHAQGDVTGLTTALAGKAATVHGHVTGDVTGLDSALAGKAPTVHTHAQSDVTGLGTTLAAKADLVGGKVPTSQIPAVALVEYLGTAANQAAMLAKTGQPGDWVNRTDSGTTWQITGADPTVLGNWTEMLYPASPVQSVAGKTGAVTLSSADVGLGNVDNTSDANKPVSTAQSNALALKAPLASPTFTGTVTGVTAAMVGLGNVTNTSDANKPVSTAQQTALNLKAPLASPAFTGTVTGVTAAMVGLGNVTNTSDANKPVSTAQQTALDAKLPLIRTWNGTAYVADTDALIYAGPTDPGAVPDGSIWVEVA